MGEFQVVGIQGFPSVFNDSFEEYRSSEDEDFFFGAE
jgi:hypothetical protein